MPTKYRQDVTPERLRDLLSYDPSTGVFRWRANRLRRAPANKLAGWKEERGYVAIKVDGHLYRAHRLAWLYVHGRWPADQLDHINGEPGDNRIENLREATGPQNCQNQKVSIRNSSGFIGVSWCKREKKWHASIKVAGKNFSLGYFHEIELAKAARAAGKAKIHSFQPFDRT